MKKQNKIRWNYLPHKKSLVEEESTVNDYRIEAGLTWAELLKKTGLSYGELRELSIGERSPLYVKGKNTGNIKKSVLILMKFFNTEFGDLFPRYVCQLEKPFLTNTQLKYISTSIKSLNPEQNIIKKDIWEYIYKILKKNTKLYKKYYFILRLKCMGFTFEEIGKKLKTSRQYIQQEEVKAINILNKLKYKNQLI